MQTDGPKKSVKFGFLLKGVYIGASAILNQHTKFAKLQVGKQIVTAKQSKYAKIQLYPQSIAVIGLAPLQKVEVNYEPPPKNKFNVTVNGEDYFILPKEDIGFDPS